VTGPGVFQPILFAGQYQDVETAAYEEDGTTAHRPGIVINGARTNDPFTRGYLQIDPFVADTWSSYGYAKHNPLGVDDPLGMDFAWSCDFMPMPGSSRTFPGGAETINVNEETVCYIMFISGWIPSSFMGIGQSAESIWGPSVAIDPKTAMP